MTEITGIYFDEEPACTKKKEWIKPIIISGEYWECSTNEKPNTWSDEQDWKDLDDAQRYRDLKS
jgi:hypothetical protein